MQGCGWQCMAYHPVARLGEAPGERVHAVGDVGERAGGGRGGEDRWNNEQAIGWWVLAGEIRGSQ
jgi:hypothetical protein